ncbi:MAG: metallophosphoesterase [Candidatus Eremiobacteraeota bacterium]|nr:metallophosphoesterase [Candidatus Eremiobacteraeota bacterium]MBV9973172.1 metallophosphoesterase [Candidatus Eremiobacteraeota bacterium]
MKRKEFIEHVGWTGAGIAWTLSAAGTLTAAADALGSGLTFIQISDSHIGFRRPENPDVIGTLRKTVDAINRRAVQPAFVVHTGDITHLSKAEQFDTAKTMLSELRAPVLYLPGEHDVIGSPAEYFTFFSRADAKDGWFSFDQGGAHFVALVNVFNFERMGLMGQQQLDWLAKDLGAQKQSTPIVVFAHVPLYALYPQWGWTTEDGSKALALLRRFDRVTVLSGHIHQIIEHTEGNIRFATANSTAYPQPKPGTAAKPGPLLVPPDRLLGVIGYRTVQLDDRGGSALSDITLG